jgi:hypothetical protein
MAIKFPAVEGFYWCVFIASIQKFEGAAKSQTAMIFGCIAA